MSYLRAITNIYNNSAFCKILLFITACLWGSSFLIIKNILDIIPVGWMLAIRYLFAAVCVGIIAPKKIISSINKPTLRIGFILGIAGFFGFLFQNIGLMYTTPGKNAFLTGTYIVIVPFVAWAFGMGKPERFNTIGAILALVGLGFVALDGGSVVNIGDVLTLICAVFYAWQIVEMSRAPQGLNILAISFWEFIVIGGLSAVWAALRETTPQFALFTLADYGALVYLTLICSCLCIILCNHAYAHVDPAAGSIISSLEAPLGVMFSVMWGYEFLTIKLCVGFFFILCGVLLSEAGPTLIGRIA